MKTVRLFVCGLLAALVSAPAFAADSKKSETYTVAGYFIGPKPADDIIARASREIGEKMAGQKQVQCNDDADHTIEVLFKNGQYKVYVDALPFTYRISDTDRNRQRAGDNYASEYHFEQADHGLRK